MNGATMSQDLRGRWWARSDLPLYRLDQVERLSSHAFEHAGLSPDDASFAARALVDKNLADDYVRGVAMAPEMVEQLLDGTYDPRADLEMVQDGPGMAVVAAGRGFPRTMAYRAMRLCIAKARAGGIGAVGLRGLCWTLGEHLRVAVDEGLIALITTQGPATMAPWKGVEPIVSNSPIGIGIPAGDNLPIILDMSMTQTSLTPLWAAFLEGRSVPPGLLLDAEGRPTINPGDVVGWEGSPRRAVVRGSLLPIGGYKGYALAVPLMVLSSLLIGTRPAGEGRARRDDGRPIARAHADPAPGRHVGHRIASPGTLFICIDVEQFTPLAAFRAAVDELLDTLTGSRRAGDDEIVYPGLQSGRLQAARRQRNVVPLLTGTRDVLNALADRLGLDDRIGEPIPGPAPDIAPRETPEKGRRPR